MRPVPRPKNHLDSFRYAVEGIVHTFRTQKHMRFHFFTVVLVLLISALLRMNRVEMAILFLVVSSVLIAEMLNTAIESVVDMVTQAYHPLAKLAKDIAAGAVLIAAINAVVVGIILFLKDRRIARLSIQIDHDPQPMNVMVTVTLLILIIVMLSKVVGGKGSLLHGGIVSGHAALSFCLAATIMYRAADFLTTALAVGLALLVAQSRVEGKIHTLQEVIVGGLLGVFVTTLIYFVRVPL
ncbi:MAG: diacylglycerol kinase [Capsulimonas sp.]|uniref:diacylglycerol kinase n=1 Tax=Capsulimonas sp. TaxID=2494211 RepID=UPI003265D4E2|nr:Phosphoesterase, PA-phosphatase related:Prokaryotic diacylglycerol kinase [Capsulimonas sp.]